MGIGELGRHTWGVAEMVAKGGNLIGLFGSPHGVLAVIVFSYWLPRQLGTAYGVHCSV